MTDNEIFGLYQNRTILVNSDDNYYRIEKLELDFEGDIIGVDVQNIFHPYWNGHVDSINVEYFKEHFRKADAFDDDLEYEQLRF